jgi:glycosyltransferase involved in cell wall biosynthesis
MKKLLLIGSNCVHTYNYFHLIKSYFDQIVMVTDDPHELIDAKISNCYYVNSSLKKLSNYSIAIKTYKDIIEEENPDVIHIQQISTYSFLLLRALKKSKKKIPVVLTTWGSDVLLLPEKGFIFKKMVQYVLNHCDKFTTDAQFVADRMQQLARKPLHTVIANFGINVVDIEIDKENIIYSNRLHKPLYRVDKIIKAFHLFSQQHPDWKLVVGAVGTETDNLKQLTKELNLEDKVTFIGWVDAAVNSKMYAKSRMWVSIPESDATSISLLEAMSLGAIPVVIDLPANREWIQHGVNGIIVNNIETNFLEESLSIDFDKAAQINTDIIHQKGTKETNQKLFFAIYDDLK